MNAAAAPETNSSVRAAEAGEIVRTTGERVEMSLWDALDAILLRIPEMIGFLLAVVIGWLVGRTLARIVFRRLDLRGRTDLGRLLGSITVGVTVALFALFALTWLFPAFDPVNILSLLGVGSIAIGFAFKDILQNLAAGLILLAREPYKTGDEIMVGGGEYEGVVEEVEMRATHIRTVDQRLIVIPNVLIFNNAITVNTDCDFRLSSTTVSIAYGGDPHRSIEIVREAVQGAEGVREEPPAAVTISALNDFSIDLYIVYAAGPTIVEQIQTKGGVLLAIHDACRANGIVLPFPTQVNLLRTVSDQGPHPQRFEPGQGDDETARPDKLDGLPMEPSA